jgi:hypothetical protein
MPALPFRYSVGEVLFFKPMEAQFEAFLPCVEQMMKQNVKATLKIVASADDVVFLGNETKDKGAIISYREYRPRSVLSHDYFLEDPAEQLPKLNRVAYKVCTEGSKFPVGQALNFEELRRDWRIG